MGPMNDDHFRRMMMEDPSLAGVDPQEEQAMRMVFESLGREPGGELPAGFADRVIATLERKEALRSLLFQTLMVILILALATTLLWGLQYFAGVSLVEVIFREVVSHLWLILPGLVGLFAVQFADHWLFGSGRMIRTWE